MNEEFQILHVFHKFVTRNYDSEKHNRYRFLAVYLKKYFCQSK